MTRLEEDPFKEFPNLATLREQWKGAGSPSAGTGSQALDVLYWKWKVDGMSATDCAICGDPLPSENKPLIRWNIWWAIHHNAGLPPDVKTQPPYHRDCWRILIQDPTVELDT